MDETSRTTAARGTAAPPRSPARAALCSAFFIGGGQLYNKQLEQAVLFWIWTALLLAVGLALLLLGFLGSVVPPALPRPPLGDWVADHGTQAALCWTAALAALWAAGVRQAYAAAERINRGEVVIRHRLREQAVHVLASQILGGIPIVGLFFPPRIVAEAVDAVRERRGPDRDHLLREGRQALIEWALTRAAIYLLWVFLGLWALWWLLRGLGIAP